MQKDIDEQSERQDRAYVEYFEEKRMLLSECITLLKIISSQVYGLKRLRIARKSLEMIVGYKSKD